MSDELKEFGFLWENPKEGEWVLVRDPEPPHEFFILNRSGTQTMCIATNELTSAVIKRMIDEGCEILDEFPKAEDTVVAIGQ